MHFRTKNTLKNNHYHIFKHPFIILKKVTFLSRVNYKIALILYAYILEFIFYSWYYFNDFLV